jgi:hypothetical protein
VNSEGFAKDRSFAKDVAENVLEVGVATEPGAARSARITSGGPPCPRVLAIGARLLGVEARLHAGHPKLVVQLALLRIREHVVRLGDLLEALLGRPVARVDVRVVLARELAVALFDLGAGRSARHAKSGVEVLLRHRARWASGGP